MRKRTLPTAVMTLAALVAIAGCGGKSESGSGSSTKSGTTSTNGNPVHKKPAKAPSY